MKITCDVIQDLLPLYVDDAVSEDSRILVEEHLKDCDTCKKEEEQLRAGQGAFENLKEAYPREEAEVIASFLKIRRSILRKRILAVCVVLVCTLALFRVGHYFYSEKKDYLSLEESGLVMRGDELYATKTYYGRLEGIVSPDQKITFLFCYETPEIRKNYPSAPCDLMVTDYRRPFQMTDEELKENDAVRIEKVYYLPENFDYKNAYKASDYDSGNADEAAEKTEMLESISTLLWDVENGAAEIQEG